MSNPDNPVTLWPNDALPEAADEHDNGPDTELAIVLLASGCTQSFIRHRCGFESQRDVQAFCRDEDVRREVEALAAERVKRLGKRAMVKLEQLVSTDHTDLRAQVLAVRTALEVAGDLKRDHSPPAKSVRELSVSELSELIDATRIELQARIGRYRAGRDLTSATSAAQSDT